MPIDPIALQRRHAEVGRIRLGQKVSGTSRAGKEYTRPAKLDRFRFTSPNADLIAAIAELYGGEAKPWQNDTLTEHEVITEATSIPVNVLKGGCSQWFEFWTAGGCKHRCTGVEDHTDPKNIVLCREDDPAHLAAIEKPTTRLLTSLTELDSLGGWRLETKGWNAASELPNMADLAAYVGDLVPARLHLAPRRKIITVGGKPQTVDFVVPVLDLLVSKSRLVELVSGASGALPESRHVTAGAAPYPTAQIASGAATQPNTGPTALEVWRSRIDACASTDAVNELWREIVASDQLFPDVKDALIARGTALSEAQPPAEQPAPAAEDPEPEQPADDETVEAEVVEDDDPVAADAAWSTVVSAAGRRQIPSDQLLRMWAQWSDGKDTAQGTASEFQRFAADLASGWDQ